ncbi:UDP-N-acetylmuramate:L-alanyl-gamma-D-glutamyl-meso-diaminopimelate ligase [Porticoccus sp. W117]|uniref:UDP-N-acetylmuramate:L-alanyl-gamma-D-glutamyl- meso-diaminopimelate ligase n=1 Tax=Porticoccus sp. W117 TaxID=3054777 RepID=UPI002594B418|nr:UDP-N-acetylmuramate:L-alanyl-gamma-D-glutamyl-meso-diaminopimelate ligase [Porticoccus sp. W117]MDM3871482.1 UDP-N-acetylmuramate:L-alanyl-gamma-D-glutamyl-meso-diaminopimelate ligase [Porticoccus sp. W117]
MHIHILGICGTFMGSLAQLAVASGHRVSGCDANVYPPMSTQLEQAGIDIIQGYDPAQLEPAPDLVVIGNAMSRGNPCVEAVLDKGIPYTSGPQWLGDVFLQDKWVLAVSGTHGKTTTSTMLAWILEYSGYQPGFLIGGVPQNFGVSARLGESPFFVVEADEYDSAFFDKRSKFVHYRPRTLIMNNLEFDHADIFADLAAIQTQFHHLVRTVPGVGKIIAPAGDKNLTEVLEKGCWSELEKTGPNQDWQAQLTHSDGSCFQVLMAGEPQGEVRWSMTGQHNVDNGLMAIAAARHVGVEPATACEALCAFEGIKRRMELLAEHNDVRVYDDFAHHPTAIATTLHGLREKVGEEKIIAVIEPRSNTMKMGHHKSELAQSTALADQVLWFQSDGMEWLDEVAENSPVPAATESDLEDLVAQTVAAARKGGHIVVMSNGGFGGFHQKLISALQET